MHEKPIMRKDIEAWRGKNFVQADLRGFVSDASA
jgi:hypothetical protein